MDQQNSGASRVAAALEKISFAAAWRIGATLETAYSLLRIKSEPRMTRFLASQLAAAHYINITRARQDFGHAPQISTAEGMRLLSEWLRAEDNVAARVH